MEWLVALAGFVGVAILASAVRLPAAVLSSRLDGPAGGLLALLEWSCPGWVGGLDDPHERMRWRFLALVNLTSLVTLAGFTVIIGLHGRPEHALANAGGMLAIALNQIVLRRADSRQLPGGLWVATMLVVVVAAALVASGSWMDAVLWLPLVSMGATLLVGARVGLGAALATLGVLATFAVVNADAPLELVSSTAMVLRLSVITALVTLVVWLYERHILAVVRDDRAALAEAHLALEGAYAKLRARADHDAKALATADQTLASTASRLRALADHLDAGVLMENLDREVVLANPRLCELLGVRVPAAALMGRSTGDLFGRYGSRVANREEVSRRIATRLREREAKRKMVLRLKGGAVLELDYAPVRVDDTVRGHLWVLRDVTETRRAQERLERSKEQAEMATHAKSRFLASMSHEIRTPMNGVLGMTSLLADSELTTGQREMVEVIQSSGDTLMKVIDDILDFSKIEAGRMELECTTFDLPRLVRDATGIVSPQAARKGLAVAVDVDPRLPPRFEGDVTRLRQVLVNLLSNAVKFTCNGGVSVRAELAARTEDALEVRFSVRDTGIGIPEDKISSLFESFQQVDATITRKHGGTGLGLAICKRLVGLMAGRLEVDSELDVGSRFAFVVPLRSASEAAAADVPAPAEAPPADLRILVAEDNPINQRVALRMLERLGYAPDLAADGAEAVRAVQSHTYDLVLMDLQMPEMDGYAAAEAIRAGPGRTRIIALTANATAEDLRRCAEVGMDGYLLKPVRLDELAAVLAGESTARQGFGWPPAPELAHVV